tara:strand:+ start:929 stop:1507 length:579 start_codon:yes stop_codon:yes gene_type:complete
MADYEIIAEGSVDGSAPTAITLGSIPGDYTHLELMFNGASTRSSVDYDDYTTIQLNADTTSGNYCRAYAYKKDGVGAPTQVRQGFGPTGAQNSMGNTAWLPTRLAGQSTKLMAYARYYFPNYSGTTLTKGMIGWACCAGAWDWPGTGGSDSATATLNGVWGWNDTSAITSITINMGYAGFAVNTSYILAGIK